MQSQQEQGQEDVYTMQNIRRQFFKTESSASKIPFNTQPIEVQRNILQFLDQKSIIRGGIRFVCKAWRQIINTHCLRTLYPSEIFSVDVQDSELKLLTNLLSAPDSRFSVQALVFTKCYAITHKGLRHLKTFRNVRAITLIGCVAITGKGLRSLAHFPGLEKLELQQCRCCDDEGMLKLKSVPTLRHLTIGSGYQLTDEGVRNGLCHLTNLEHLELIKCGSITNEGFKQLAESLTKLRYLELGRCSNVTDEVLSYFASLNNLTFLHLSSCSITENGVGHLRTQLTTLDLNFNPRIGDKGIESLQHLTSLKRLGLNCCEITDAGLQSLTRLTNLTSLDIGGCRLITTNGLVQLLGRNLSQLRELGLHPMPPGVTEEGLWEALQHEPNYNCLKGRLRINKDSELDLLDLW